LKIGSRRCCCRSCKPGSGWGVTRSLITPILFRGRLLLVIVVVLFAVRTKMSGGNGMNRSAAITRTMFTSDPTVTKLIVFFVPFLGRLVGFFLVWVGKFYGVIISLGSM